MASTNSKTAAEKPAAAETKPKRKQLTADERIAKIEAELEAAKTKAAAKVEKEINELLGQRTAKMGKLNELTLQVNELTAQLQAKGYTGDTAPAEVTQPEGTEPDDSEG